jgi:hypothetical protein
MRVRLLLHAIKSVPGSLCTEFYFICHLLIVNIVKLTFINRAGFMNLFLKAGS